MVIFSNKENVFLYYPGHLGERPHTELSGHRGILWDRANPVRLVDERFAASLVRDSGFLEALTVKDAARALGCTMKRVRELVDGGTLRQAVYQPEKAKAVEVVVFGPEDRARARTVLGGGKDG